ncbi:hypothetical protein PAMC26577_25245 [Caballeronia sordidicola]|uniref:Uncharacterized protein n=1 Tax=Caballeronia sordidicola TaxID=196367 RepID=A0A242MJ39_CABSO|nr:hypothetical protein PAMC26577_25245 [Caballeronia sordidicola]
MVFAVSLADDDPECMVEEAVKTLLSDEMYDAEPLLVEWLAK